MFKFLRFWKKEEEKKKLWKVWTNTDKGFVSSYELIAGIPCTKKVPYTYTLDNPNPIYYPPGGSDVHVYLNKKKMGTIQAFSIDEKKKGMVLINLVFGESSNGSLLESFKDGINLVEVYIKSSKMKLDEKRLLYKVTSPNRPTLSGGVSIDDMFIEETWTFEDITLEKGEDESDNEVKETD